MFLGNVRATREEFYDISGMEDKRVSWLYFFYRFLGNMRGLIALIFLAIYIANLTAFMITREKFYDISGMEDIHVNVGLL